jgi:DNA-binding response OmpR family regulator
MSHAMGTRKPGDLRGVRVLVVEDQWHVATALRSLLEVEGMEVSGPAGKAAEAHRLADEHNPELAVVDISTAEGLHWQPMPSWSAQTS